MTVLSIPDTRQSLLVAIADFDFSDFVSGVGTAVFALPQNAILLGGEITTNTVLTGSGTVAAEVGDSANAARYFASADVKTSVISSPLLITGFRVTNATRNILVEVTASGTLTAGDGQIVATYAVVGRSTENFE